MSLLCYTKRLHRRLQLSSQLELQCIFSRPGTVDVGLSLHDCSGTVVEQPCKEALLFAFRAIHLQHPFAEHPVILNTAGGAAFKGGHLCVDSLAQLAECFTLTNCWARSLLWVLCGKSICHASHQAKAWLRTPMQAVWHMSVHTTQSMAYNQVEAELADCRIAAHGKKLNRSNVMRVNVVDTWQVS